MFVKSTPSKVKFADQQLDDYVLENSVLKSKLHSKLEALSIMSKELDKCSMERDRYRLLVEQLRNKHPLIAETGARGPGWGGTHGAGGRVSGGELLAHTRDQNNQLRLEVETLRARCEESSRDVAALRRQLRLAGAEEAGGGAERPARDDLLHKMEKLNTKHRQLRQDLGAILDEKEELCADRDYYKGEVARLSRRAGCVRDARGEAARGAGCTDVDTAVTENKYLQERLAQMEVEKEILKQTLIKYKKILENRNKPFNFNNGNIDVMTEQQVRSYLEKRASSGAARKAHVSELKALCLGLFESLNDKSIALQHQRKTNRILANRISELEKTLESWANGEKYIPLFPSQMLLEEFCPDTALARERMTSDPKAPHAENGAEPKCVNSEPKFGKAKSDSTDSDDEATKTRSCHIEVKSSCSEESRSDGSGSNGRTVLPPELAELVRVALQELRPC